MLLLKELIDTRKYTIIILLKTKNNLRTFRAIIMFLLSFDCKVVYQIDVWCDQLVHSHIKFNDLLICIKTLRILVLGT